MVRVFIIVLISFLGLNICLAGDSELLAQGMEFYKKGNYEQCICAMKNVVKNDPASSLGYYYLALAYSKTGKNILALRNYDKVINLGADKTLADLARKGKACLGGKNITAIEVQIEDITEDAKDAAAQAKEEKLSPEELKAKYEDKIHKPQTAAQHASSSQNSQPTNDEIVNAIRVLQRAGLLNNGFTGFGTPQMNSKTQQMNSMLMMMGQNGNNNNNEMMNLLPYMNRGNGQINPQMLQMMMMNQMTPNFSSGY